MLPYNKHSERVYTMAIKRLDMKNPKKIKHVHVFDLDGVLLDSSHRYLTVTINGKEKICLDHWRENEKLNHLDKALPLAEYYKKLLTTKNCFVIIATSRILKVSDYTHISNVLGLPDGIVSRLHNKQKGASMKIKGINRILEDCELSQHITNNNITVYEDNIEYLKGICDSLKCIGVYIPSNQGH